MHLKEILKKIHNPSLVKAGVLKLVSVIYFFADSAGY